MREIHNDGHDYAWLHCEDKTPLCIGANSMYPRSYADIKGKWCGRDDGPMHNETPKPGPVPEHIRLAIRPNDLGNYKPKKKK